VRAPVLGAPLLQLELQGVPTVVGLEKVAGVIVGIQVSILKKALLLLMI
jgi:hypothetical protein